MILDKEIILNIKSSITIGLLNKINIKSKIGDIIILPIELLWKGSNIKINVQCDICKNQKLLRYNVYNDNISKYNIYSCNNKCSSFKNKLTSLERYGVECYKNTEKRKKTKLERYGDEKYTNTDKIKQTKLERYGDENYNNREKFAETSLERYGVINPLLNVDIIEKTKKTNLERYGVEDSRTSKLIIDKRIQTNLERYGVEHYNNRDKYTETCLEKYGTDSTNKLQSVIIKRKNTCLDRYNYISNSLTDISKQKLRETNLERYGVEYPMQVEEFFIKQQKSAKQINYFNADIYYQGTYELHFLNLINDIGLIHTISRGPTIKFMYNDKIKYHYPDFYIEKLNLIIEIKSDYYYEMFLDLNIKKQSECEKLGYKYIFIINKNYDEFLKLIN